MIEGHLQVPPVVNEPVLGYAPGSAERATLTKTLETLSAQSVEVSSHIGGVDRPTGQRHAMRMPHRHEAVLGHWHAGDASHVDDAIKAAAKAWPAWSSLPFRERAAVFLRAADLLSTRWRPILNAATMLGQSKTSHQAEIDAACELIDFFRFNVQFASKLLAEQPLSPSGVWNMLDHRPLEGFVLAVSPFNFTSIAANLPAAPALLGNTVVWKPAINATYSAHFILGLLREAGLPDGVVNMVLGDPPSMVDRALAHEDLAGVHFTGSTTVFQKITETVGNHVGAGRYKTFPRLVGETGGKDFVFAHPSAEITALAVALVRGAYEYQGQKCSAASRAFIPASLWPAVKSQALDMIAAMKVGDPADFTNFLGAVIDHRAYERLSGRVESAKNDARCEVLASGASDAVGYFIHPTLIRTDDPVHPLMRDELFGPVLTVYVYADDRIEETFDLCDKGSPYGLTGAFFARDRAAIDHATRRLRFSAGNFYVNDKPTGAVVGQQPFGGARSSGTNDKAGSILNLLRWVSPRTIKETLTPPTDWRYSFLG